MIEGDAEDPLVANDDEGNNSYVMQHIIDSFTRILKWIIKLIRFKLPVLISNEKLEDSY